MQCDWNNANKILNTSVKTRCTIFSYKKKLPLSGIKINNVEIQKRKSTKFLIVILDEHLTFKYHVDYLKMKNSHWVEINAS